MSRFPFVCACVCVLVCVCLCVCWCVCACVCNSLNTDQKQNSIIIRMPASAEHMTMVVRVRSGPCCFLLLLRCSRESGTFVTQSDSETVPSDFCFWQPRKPRTARGFSARPVANARDGAVVVTNRCIDLAWLDSWDDLLQNPCGIFLLHGRVLGLKPCKCPLSMPCKKGPASHMCYVLDSCLAIENDHFEPSCAMKVDVHLPSGHGCSISLSAKRPISERGWVAR